MNGDFIFNSFAAGFAFALALDVCLGVVIVQTLRGKN